MRDLVGNKIEWISSELGMTVEMEGEIHYEKEEKYPLLAN